MKGSKILEVNESKLIPKFSFDYLYVIVFFPNPSFVHCCIILFAFLWHILFKIVYIASYRLALLLALIPRTASLKIVELLFSSFFSFFFLMITLYSLFFLHN